MKFYIASAWDRREEVRQASKLLEAAGHKNIRDWTTHDEMLTEQDWLDHAMRHAFDDMEGVLNVDFFVLLNPGCPTTGGHMTEFGMAIGAYVLSDVTSIYVVHEDGQRNHNIFEWLPFVTVVSSIEEIIEDINSWIGAR